MLPWNERVTMLSINPDAATRDDVARLATELMECHRLMLESVENCPVCRSYNSRAAGCARCITFMKELDGNNS